MKLTFDEWGGLSPRIPKYILPSQFAQASKNANSMAFALTPFKEAKADSTLSLASPSTVYLHKSSPNKVWYEFADTVDVIKAPIVNDSENFVIIGGNGDAKITNDTLAMTSAPYPNKTYHLGLPIPEKPTAEAIDTTPPDDYTELHRVAVSYVITMVDAWGRESAPSLPSATVYRFETPSQTQEVQISLPCFDHTDDRYPLADGATKAYYKIYRSATVGNEFGFFYLAKTPYVWEQGKDTILLADSKSTDELDELIPSENWYSPPTSDTSLYPQGAIDNLCVVANEFLCGNTGDTVCYSESRLPHAFPPQYQKVLPHKVVALAPIGSDVLALTEGYPYLLSGSHPTTVSLIKITHPQSCISKRSVVTTNTAVYYASPDGLCVFSGVTVENITRNVLMPSDWQAMKPETLVGWFSEGMYFGKTETHSFVINPQGEARLLTHIDFDYSCGFVDLKTDTFYVVKGNKLSQWGKGDNNLTVTHKSGIRRLPNHTNFAWLSVRAETYPVTVTITPYRDGQTEMTNHIQALTVTSDEPVILKSGYAANAWEVEVEATGTVFSVELAHARTEFYR